jgi:hypothetical protein
MIASRHRTKPTAPNSELRGIFELLITACYQNWCLVLHCLLLFSLLVFSLPLLVVFLLFASKLAQNHHQHRQHAKRPRSKASILIKIYAACLFSSTYGVPRLMVAKILDTSLFRIMFNTTILGFPSSTRLW